jgi:hypothetical protein
LPTPLYSKLSNLIRHDWWTQFKGTTDSAGTFRIKATYGSYVASLRNHTGQTVTREISFLKKNGRSQKITIHL